MEVNELFIFQKEKKKLNKTCVYHMSVVFGFVLLIKAKHLLEIRLELTTSPSVYTNFWL